MSDPTQFDAERVRVALDRGEVVELDGGTLVLDGEPSPSVVLRLAPWRARSLSWVLEEWSALSRVFNRPPRPSVDELDLSRVLELASAAAADDDDEPEPGDAQEVRLLRVAGPSSCAPRASARRPKAAALDLGKETPHQQTVGGGAAPVE
jgi:hypothetical protein